MKFVVGEAVVSKGRRGVIDQVIGWLISIRYDLGNETRFVDPADVQPLDVVTRLAVVVEDGLKDLEK